MENHCLKLTLSSNLRVKPIRLKQANMALRACHWKNLKRVLIRLHAIIKMAFQKLLPLKFSKEKLLLNWLQVHINFS